MKWWHFILLVKRLIGLDAGGYADDCWQFVCACAVVFPPKWWSRLLWCHKIMSQESLMCKREESIKREAQLSSRSLAAAVLSSGCLDILFRVFYEATDPLLWLSWCLSCRKHYPDAQCYLFYQKVSILTCLEDFELLWLYLSDDDQGGPLPSPLEPGIEQSTDHNPSVANCVGGINH